MHAAAEAGVVRLASVTGLDLIGWPVWHSVRPRSATVAVHAGKGRTVRQAMAGALAEACEAYAAESWRPAGPKTWLRPLGGDGFCVPSETLLLDYRRRVSGSSAGVAAAPKLGGAVLRGLLELVERDALAAWMKLGAAAQGRTRLPTPPALAAPVARARAAGLVVAFYGLPARGGAAAVACALVVDGPAPLTVRQTLGAAARLDDRSAAVAAWGEACQSRCGWLAGVRDDLPEPAEDDRRRGAPRLLPPPVGVSGRLAADAAPASTDPAETARRFGRRLAAEGLGPVGFVDLTPPGWRRLGPRVARVVAPRLRAMPLP